METGPKYREAASESINPGCLGPIFIGVTVLASWTVGGDCNLASLESLICSSWLPGLVTAKVVGQNSVFIYGLDTVHLYSQASREIKFETASSSRSLNFIWEWL